VSRRCTILTHEQVIQYILRYDAVKVPPLTDDEQELLLFALYLESSEREGGLVKEARERWPKLLKEKP
jgi:hypothetical protein